MFDDANNELFFLQVKVFWLGLFKLEFLIFTEDLFLLLLLLLYLWKIRV